MNPLYKKPLKDQLTFIIHIVDTSGRWDHRREFGNSPFELPDTIPRAPLGSVSSLNVIDNVYIIHAYAARCYRSPQNVHPICYAFLGKCIMQLKDIDGLKCDIFLSIKSCRFYGANPEVVKEMIQVVLKDVKIKEI